MKKLKNLVKTNVLQIKLYFLNQSLNFLMVVKNFYNAYFFTLMVVFLCAISIALVVVTIEQLNSSAFHEMLEKIKFLGGLSINGYLATKTMLQLMAILIFPVALSAFLVKKVIEPGCQKSINAFLNQEQKWQYKKNVLTEEKKIRQENHVLQISVGRAKINNKSTYKI